MAPSSRTRRSSSAVDYGLADLPSDDPRTPLVDDPTRDVVGNYPLLFAPKTAALLVDNSSPGVVDPGDVLRYTITVYNNGSGAGDDRRADRRCSGRHDLRCRLGRP